MQDKLVGSIRKIINGKYGLVRFIESTKKMDRVIPNQIQLWEAEIVGIIGKTTSGNYVVQNFRDSKIYELLGLDDYKVVKLGKDERQRYETEIQGRKEYLEGIQYVNVLNTYGGKNSKYLSTGLRLDTSLNKQVRKYYKVLQEYTKKKKEAIDGYTIDIWCNQYITNVYMYVIRKQGKIVFSNLSGEEAVQQIKSNSPVFKQGEVELGFKGVELDTEIKSGAIVEYRVVDGQTRVLSKSIKTGVLTVSFADGIYIVGKATVRIPAVDFKIEKVKHFSENVTNEILKQEGLYDGTGVYLEEWE